jgi:hypothetical protein
MITPAVDDSVNNVIAANICREAILKRRRNGGGRGSSFPSSISGKTKL